MQTFIHTQKSPLVPLHDLRAGDNFEHGIDYEGWVFKVVDMMGTTIEYNVQLVHAVVENSGEIISFHKDSLVHPLMSEGTMFNYDFNQQYLEDRT